MADLFNVREIFNIPYAEFNYFESHEGKSTSDTIGSIVKGAFTRGTLKSDFGITSIDDILTLINSEIKPSTKKFKFFVVEKFGWFRKKTSESRPYCKIQGISKIHSFKIYDEEMVAQQYSCTESLISFVTLAIMKKRLIQVLSRTRMMSFMSQQTIRKKVRFN